jgi:hypothetical protein
MSFHTEDFFIHANIYPQLYVSLMTDCQVMWNVEAVLGRFFTLDVSKTITLDIQITTNISEVKFILRMLLPLFNDRMAE